MEPLEPLDLGMISNDIADTLHDHHGIDVTSDEVRRHVVPFLDALAPGRLTPEQRIGLDLLR